MTPLLLTSVYIRVHVWLNQNSKISEVYISEIAQTYDQLKTRMWALPSLTRSTKGEIQ
jgi:hypothetical protein